MKKEKNKPHAKMAQGRKAIVALSGGVDSSVTAALLKRAGFDVGGVFFRLYDLDSSKEGERSARKIAKNLKIPFSVLDLRKQFKKLIINYFLKEQKAGRTPNPCVLCNKEIKFNFLFKEAQKQKADFTATGHYARIKNGKIYRAKDKQKDQSYFLWKLNQKQLKKILLPIGEMNSKSETIKIAKKMRLPVFNKKESQEICFIKGKLKDFLKNNLNMKSGDILNKNREKIGKHEGLYFYTIGQRKGTKVEQGPWYVLEKDPKNNNLIVIKAQKDLEKKELIAKEINWVSGKPPKFPLKIKAKIRSRANLVAATVLKDKNKQLKIIFKKSQKAITPGQSVVFYLPTEALAKAGESEELIGGGIIFK